MRPRVIPRSPIHRHRPLARRARLPLVQAVSRHERVGEDRHRRGLGDLNGQAAVAVGPEVRVRAHPADRLRREDCRAAVAHDLLLSNDDVECWGKQG